MGNGKRVLIRAVMVLLVLVVVVGGLVVRHQRAQIASLRGQVAQLQLDSQNGEMVVRSWAACAATLAKPQSTDRV